MIVFAPGMLRQCHKKNKLKQADVAKVLCKSPGCISKQENGDMRVSAEDLAAYADLYDVSVNLFYKETLQWQRNSMQ